MRTSLIAGALIAGIGYVGTASAAPLTDTKPMVSGQSLVEHAQSSSYCRRLRRACQFKDERGERGEGNCRRYRRVCR
jgi:hypothetical protein